MEKAANAQYQTRLDTGVLDMRKTKARGSLTDGFYSAHENRFESNAASGFCGGSV